MHNLAIIGFDIRMEFAEAGKVLIVKQGLGSLIHPLKVRRLEQTAAILAVERRLGGSDIILIHTRRSIKASMCIGLHGPQAVYGNIGRKQTIQLIRHKNSVQRRITVKVSYHQ